MAKEEKTKYRLKDQETSFYDDESGLSVTRDEEVEIGMAKGKRTLAMIKSGGLLRVDSSTAEGGAATGATAAGTKQSSAQPKSGPLPEDFPGAKVLAENKITTYAQLAQLSPEQVVDIKGIGPKTAEDIERALGR